MRSLRRQADCSVAPAAGWGWRGWPRARRPMPPRAASSATPGTRRSRCCALRWGALRSTSSGDWTVIAVHGLFDLLVLDGAARRSPGRLGLFRGRIRGGYGCAACGTLVDDFYAAHHRPLLHEGCLMRPWLHWSNHPELYTVQHVSGR